MTHDELLAEVDALIARLAAVNAWLQGRGPLPRD